MAGPQAIPNGDPYSWSWGIYWNVLRAKHPTPDLLQPLPKEIEDLVLRTPSSPGTSPPIKFTQPKKPCRASPQLIQGALLH